MKKSLIILSILLVAAILALPLIDRLNRGELTEKKDFAIQNPETVDSIFLANKAGEHLFLRKTANGTWTVNNHFNAAPDKIERLLKTMTKLEAKNPVAQSAQKEIVNNLAAEGIKVEVYQKGEKTKTYYVGGNTTDQRGTFMYIEGSTIPFVVHIPGFVGYLNSRYSVKELEWRDRAIFSTSLEDLKTIEVTYPDNAKNSFVLERTGNDFVVKHKGEAPTTTNQQLAKQYAALFPNLTFEAFISGYTQGFVDSLRSATPKSIIAVGKNDGSQRTLRIYYKPITSDTKTLYDDEGKLLVYDADNFYALIDGSNELITVQDYVFRHVFRKYEDFTAATAKAN